MQPGEGERLHAARRRRFWLIIGGLALTGAAAGFVSGFITGHGGGTAALSPTQATLAAAGVVIVAFLAAYGSWRFFVDVDEVELADNLWGSLIGFYAYAILFPAWWALERVGRAPAVDHWVIYGVAMVTALAAYGYRKWQNR